jgi:hypothetical protein
MGRSIKAVVGGFLWILLARVGAFAALTYSFPDTFPALRNEGFTAPPAWMSLLVLALTVPCGLLGGYMAGIIAGRSEPRHGLAAGLVAAGVDAVVLLSYERRGFTPPWCLVAFPIVLVPSALLGGGLRALQRRPPPAS